MAKVAHSDSFAIAASDLDPDFILSGDDEKEKERQIQNFVITSRALFIQDGIDTLSDTDISKWLFGKGGHRGKAMAALSESLTWRRNFRIESLLTTEHFDDLDATGKLQFWGHALDKSCVVVWTGSRHVPPKSEQDVERMIRYVIYKIEKAKRNGDLKDKITIIYDRTGMPMDKSDFKIASTLVPILQNHYPDRLSRVYIFPNSALFWPLLKFTKMYMDPATVSKIQLKDSAGPLAEWISRENLFVRHGGLAKDPYDSEASVVSRSGSAAALRDSKTNSGAADWNSSASEAATRTESASATGTGGGNYIAASPSSGSLAGSAAAASTTLPRMGGLKRGATVRGIEKPTVMVEQVWEAPVEFQDA